MVLGYLSMFPFLSERKFRDAFHFSVYKRYKYAIEDMKQAIEYSPWESYYMIILGRHYQDYYHSTEDKALKERLLVELERLYLNTLKYDKYNPWVYLYLTQVYGYFQEFRPEKFEFYQS